MTRVAVALLVVLGAVLTAFSTQAQPRTLTLNDAIEIAEEQSTFVGISREILQRQRQNVLNAYGGFLPSLSANFYAGRVFSGPTASIFLDASGRAIEQVGQDFEQYNFGINSQMTLFNWGVNVNTLKSAEKNATAAQHDLSYQKTIIAARVIREYYTFVLNKNLLVVQEDAVDAAQRNLEQVEAFYNIGSNTKADVLQARVRLGNTQLDLITAKNNQEIAKATLATTLNFGIEEEYDVVASLDIAEVQPNLQDEVDYTLAHRSDLDAARSRLSGAGNSQRSAEGARWPILTANLGYGWNNREFPDDANFFRNEYNWNLGVSMNWNIFDGFQNKSRIIDAKAARRVAEYDLQQAKLDAILEVKTIITILNEADERMRVSEDQVAQAAENLRLAEERYRVGAGTQLESIEAGAQLTLAQSSLVRAKVDYLVAKADLLRATGRVVTTE